MRTSERGQRGHSRFFSNMNDFDDIHNAMGLDEVSLVFTVSASYAPSNLNTSIRG